MSRSIAEAVAGNPNSFVAEIRDVAVKDEGWSGLTGGFSAASAGPAKQAVQNSAPCASHVARYPVVMRGSGAIGELDAMADIASRLLRSAGQKENPAQQAGGVFD